MIIIVNNSKLDEFNIECTNKIIKIISDLIGNENVIVNIDNEMNEFIFRNKNQIKGVILSGSELRINNKIKTDIIFDNITPFLIKDIPVLGICFGHQLLCKLYQGKVNSLKKKNKGEKYVKLTKDPIFDKIPNNSLMYFDHYDYVSEIPQNFKIIGTTIYNRIAAIKHQSKLIYGIQFHPENSNPNALKIYENFIHLCYQT